MQCNLGSGVNRGKELVHQYRQKILHGFFIDLVPVSGEYAKDIVMLRNTNRVRYNMNQQSELTVEDQLAWISTYFSRDNDLYWCILDKNGEFLGTYRMYDIDFENKVAEVGSTIIVESRAKERPYMIESALLTYQVMFGGIGIEKIVAHTRSDNVKVRSINKHLGAVETGMTRIQGVDFINTEVDRLHFAGEKLNNILMHWINRETKRSHTNKSYCLREH